MFGTSPFASTPFASLEAAQRKLEIAIYGVTADTSVGTLPPAISGVSAEGTVGSVGTGQSLVGVSADATLSSEGITPTQAITGVTANGTVTSVTSKESTHELSNVSTGTYVGNVTLGTRSISITGVSANQCSVGSLVFEKLRYPTGVSASGTVGTVTKAPRTFTLSGNTAAGTVGDVEAVSGVFVQLNAVTAYATLGNMYNVYGITATITAGTPVATPRISLFGNYAITAVNTVTPIQTLRGVTATGTVGLIKGGQAISGVSATGTVNSPQTSRTKTLSGVSAIVYNRSPIPGKLVSITGASATTAVGKPVATPRITLKKQNLNTSVGSVNKSFAPRLTGRTAIGYVNTFKTGQILKPGVLAETDVGFVSDARSITLRSVSAAGTVGTVKRGTTPISISGVSATTYIGAGNPRFSVRLTAVVAPTLAGNIPGAGYVDFMTAVYSAGVVGKPKSLFEMFLTGNTATTSTGRTNMGRYLSGVLANGTVGKPAVDRTRDISGVSAVAGIRNLSVREFKIPLTKVSASGYVKSLKDAGQILKPVTASTSVGSVNVHTHEITLEGVDARTKINKLRVITTVDVGLDPLVANTSVGDVHSGPFIKLTKVSAVTHAGDVISAQMLEPVTAVTSVNGMDFQRADFLTEVIAETIVGELIAVPVFPVLGVTATGSVGDMRAKSGWNYVKDAENNTWGTIATNNATSWTTVENSEESAWDIIETI